MPSSAGDADSAGVLDAMIESDLDEVLAIERASYGRPWQRRHFLHELQSNPVAVSRVLRLGGRVAGYICVWRIAGELTINNIAIEPARRGRGLGGRLLRATLEEARCAGCTSATLEVRPSNLAARALYEREGFVETGRRPGYYVFEGEDALVLSRSI